MLQTLKKKIKRVINFFMELIQVIMVLMNKFSKNLLINNLEKSKMISISPLEMSVSKRKW